ncbi:MAG: alpha-amylase family glycosyl hydrolase [Polyangiaceae bacterium]
MPESGANRAPPSTFLRRARALTAVALAAFATAGLTEGCGASPPKRDCFARIWVPAGGVEVFVKGDFTGWEPAPLLHPYGDDWRLARLDLPPGDYGYLLSTPAGDVLDPANPLTTWRASDELEVSLLEVTDCSAPYLYIESAVVDGATATLAARFLASSSGEGLDSASLKVVDGDVELTAEADPETGVISVVADLAPGKHTLELTARDSAGAEAPAARASLWVNRQMPEWEDGVLYQIMLDRYYGDDGAALDTPATPGSRAGGTLDGVRAALERGELARLGVTALWISPVYTTPTEPRQGVDGHTYEGYHGYWPSAPTGVEPRIGGDDALDRLIAVAHEHGVAVLLDIVPNHVYETHPRYTAHADDGWFNPAGCVCGTPDCPWGENIGVCWFTDYLPDHHLENPDALADVIAETSNWLSRYDFDGARVDAVPMMPRGATRRLLHELRHELAPSDARFFIGEVFTGPGLWGLGELKAYIGAPGLDSVFDFPLMWATRDAIATQTGSFQDVEDVLALEESEFKGSGVVLGRFLDNHDVPRFIAAATHEGGNDPWSAPPAQPLDDSPYDRMELAFALMFTLPGLPVLFQGDEVGLTGANDPDNRRVMPDEATLSNRQIALRDSVSRFSSLRACSEALRRGDRRLLHVGATQYAYLRGEDTVSPVLVVLSTAPSASSLVLEDVPDGSWVDAETGELFEASGGTLQLSLSAPLDHRILLRADDPCAE